MRISAKNLALLQKRASQNSVAKSDTETEGKARRKPKTSSHKEQCLMQDYDGEPVWFNVSITPQPKERARTFINFTKIASIFVSAKSDVRRFMALLKSSGVMNTVTPEKTKQFESALRLSAIHIMTTLCREPFSCPVFMDITIFIEGDERYCPIQSKDGDLDNHEKAIKDALNTIAYTDDRLVMAKASRKMYRSTPGLEICIRPLKIADLTRMSPC